MRVENLEAWLNKEGRTTRLETRCIATGLNEAITTRLDQETIRILNKYIRQNEISDNKKVLFL